MPEAMNAGDIPFVSMFMDNFVWDTALSSGQFDNENFGFYPLAAGSYLVKVISDKQTKTVKVLKR